MEKRYLWIRISSPFTPSKDIGEIKVDSGDDILANELQLSPYWVSLSGQELSGKDYPDFYELIKKNIPDWIVRTEYIKLPKLFFYKEST